MKMHEEMESLRLMILKQTMDIDNIKKEKEYLMKINFGMGNEIIKLKVALSTPHGKKAYREIRNDELDQSTLAIAKLQKHLMEDSDNSDNEADLISPILSPLPDKVNTKPKGMA